MSDFTIKGITERLKILKGRKSLKEFASMLNIPISTLYYYFNGRDPSLSFLLKVCKELNVREEWLLFGKGPIYKEPEKKVSNEEYIDVLLEFIKLKWKTLSEKERNWLEIQLQRMFPDLSDWLSKQQIY